MKWNDLRRTCKAAVFGILLAGFSVTCFAEAESKAESVVETAFIAQDDKESIIKVQKMLIQLGYLNGNADGIFGKMSLAALQNFQNEHSLNVTEVIDQATYDALAAAAEEAIGIVSDEKEVDAWESQRNIGLFTYMKAWGLAGFDCMIPSGKTAADQKETPSGMKEVMLIYQFKDSGQYLSNGAFFYDVKSQHIYDSGLVTDEEEAFESSEFKEACARVLWAYDSKYDQASDSTVLNLTFDRAKEIVEYCFANAKDTGVTEFIAEDMKIRILKENRLDYYLFSVLS